MVNTMLDAALDYARDGWPIFPCNFRKEPYVSRGCYDATTNEAKIREWWNKWPDANIGMSPGDIGCMVIDLDPGHNTKDLENNIGPLPETKLKQKTPRGGYHLFYELDADERVGNSIGKLADHVDVRSSGGYVLLAPSKTENGEYTWVAEGEPARRTAAMLAAAIKPSEKDKDRDRWIIDPDLPENIELAKKWLLDEAKPAVKGQGGNNMAFATAAMMKTYGLNYETGLDLMWEHWAPRCSPPWYNFDTLDKVTRHAYAYNQNPPGHITPAYREAKQKEFFTPVRTLSKSGGMVERSGRLRIVDYTAMLDIPPPTWLLEDTLPAEGYMILHGKRGSYKSFLAMDMALTVASGMSTTWKAAKTGRVLYCASEGRSGIAPRVKAWSAARCGGMPVPGFYLGDPVPSIKTMGENPDEIEAFIELALKVSPDGFDLIVLDTVGRAMAGMEENSSKDASMFTQFVEKLQTTLGAAVIAIHHGEDKARGSTVFEADADVVLMAIGEGDQARLRMTKQKDGKEWDADRAFKMVSRDGSLVPEGTDTVLEDRKPARADTGPAEMERLIRVKVEDLTVDEALKDLLRVNPLVEYSARHLGTLLSRQLTGQSAESLRKKVARLVTLENTYARRASQPSGRSLVFRYAGD